ncbi:MAG: hypothetical protein ABIJ14_03810 [Nanoarchaeota archaeon]
MKSIKELKNPDIIEISGEEYQVIVNTSHWYHTDKKELEMSIELIKVKEKQMTPNYMLTYIYERSDERKFFVFDKELNEWKEIELKSVKF